MRNSAVRRGRVRRTWRYLNTTSRRLRLALLRVEQARAEAERLANSCKDTAEAFLILRGWCGRGDSNPHGIATASPSSWCVCQFRHFRARWADLKVRLYDLEITSAPGQARGPVPWLCWPVPQAPGPLSADATGTASAMSAASASRGCPPRIWDR